MKPTSRNGSMIDQIAREAGCSNSTVSRIINGYQKGFSVRPELKERVLELVKEFNYTPNPYLRSMRSPKTKMIAVFDPYEQAYGVAQKAKREFIDIIHRHGYTEASKYVDHRDPESYSLIFPVDGALVFDIADQAYLRFVENAELPYIVVNGMAGQHGISVLPDEDEGMKMLFQHLLARGHRRIAYFAGHEIHPDAPKSHYSIEARENGYLDQIRRFDLPYTSPRWTEEISPREFLNKCLADQVDAVICYDHVKVVKLMHAAAHLGLEIPRQLSLCCFNDEFPIQYLTPEITCLATPGPEMGRLAARLLMDMLESTHSEPGRIIKLSGRLVERNSVGDRGK